MIKPKKLAKKGALCDVKKFIIISRKKPGNGAF